MMHLLQDLRFAVRQLARQRSFAVIAVLTLAFGIGGTTTFFSVLNAVALRPIPFPDPDRLIALQLKSAHATRSTGLSARSLRAVEDMHDVFSGAAAFATRSMSAAAAGASAERVQAAEIGGDLFSVLGVPPVIGRPLTDGDRGTRVAVISHALWVRLFGSDPNVLRAELSLDGEPYAIVGVAAPGFSFPEDSRVWLPFTSQSVQGATDTLARIRPDVSLARADGALRAASADILAGNAAAGSDSIVVMRPLRQIMLGTKQRNMALFVLTAAALILLIACANLGGLLTAQLRGRRHEIALRAAIGASRRRIVQQLMTECALLALAGGTLGVLLAQWGVAAFAATLGKPQGAEWVDVSIDGRVLLFTMLASAATAFLFGLVPAIGSSRVDLRNVLQEDRTSAGSQPSERRVRSVLVATQVALAIGLVAGALSIVVSSIRFEDLDPGFTRAGLVTIKVDLAGRAYEHAEQRLAFVDAAIQRVRILPGVSGVGVASHVPLVDRFVPQSTFVPEGTEVTGRPPSGSLRFVDADYLAVMGIPIHRGRGFTSSEARALHGTAIVVNESMARRYWPDRDPIGSRLRLGGAKVEGTYEVIGVTGDVAQRTLPAPPENQMYLPLASAAEALTLVVRTPSDAASIAVSAREAVREMDRSVAVSAQTMTSAFRWYVMDRRLQGLVVGTVGLIAILVAALGIYGIVSLMVSERNREFAIRRALGASNASVMRLVLGKGVGLCAAGIAAGLLVAVALTTFLSSIFLGVRAFDLAVLTESAGILGSVALAACWWPARRAMALDPMTVLKQ